MAQQVIFVDTMLMIWALQDHPSDNRPDMPARTRSFIAEAVAAGDRFSTCSICVAEFHAGISSKDRASYERQILARFLVVPFDMPAARHAAELHNTYKDQTCDGDGPTRRVLAADTKIAGTAMAFAPHVFVTDDSAFKRLFSKHLAIKEIPPLSPKIVELPLSERK